MVKGNLVGADIRGEVAGDLLEEWFVQISKAICFFKKTERNAGPPGGADKIREQLGRSVRPKDRIKNFQTKTLPNHDREKTKPCERRKIFGEKN